MIAEFIKEYPDFYVVPIGSELGFSSGRSDWIADIVSDLPEETVRMTDGTARLWPHLIKGEGHYIAVLERWSEKRAGKATNASVNRSAADLSPWWQFYHDQLELDISGVEMMFGEHLYMMPQGLPSLDGIKVIKPGWYMGAVRKNRFEPAHALALGLRIEEAVRVLSLSSTGDEAVRYLKGETLIIEEQRIHRKHSEVALKGHCLVCIDGFPVGWGKWQEGIIKNEYPAGWRWMS
jgi:NOL1/NOP2/fmu family ribosome biogenesis protein